MNRIILCEGSAIIMFKKLAFLSPTLLLMAMAVDAKANVAESSLPWGRAQFSAAGATQNLGTVGADFMLPIYGNQHGFVYSDAMGDYGTDATYIMSPGVGYRGLYDNQIFGAYFFDDYEKTSYGANFWVLSPGLEWISPVWDAHINGYFPTTTRQQSGVPAFANTFGDYSYVTFENNTNYQYDMFVTPYAVIGDGADASIGYSFDLNGDHLRSRISLGTYYYQAPSDANVDDITGLTFTYSNALTQDLAVSITNSYDQLNHFNVSMNLTYTFGGESNSFSSNIQDRLFDSVERHIGIISTGAGQYDQQALENQGMGLEYDNIYFASPNGTGDGTYGNPMELDQSNLSMAYDQHPEGARIYLQGGSDSIYHIGSQSALTTDGLAPADGIDFYGRTSDYTAPASYSERPQIEADKTYNAFVLYGGENTFSDLNIYSQNGSNSNITGIQAKNSSSNETLTINNATISGFATGVYINNVAGDFTINLNNSQLSENGATGLSAYGMQVFNSSDENVVINATNSEFNHNSGSVVGAGLYLVNSGAGDLTLNAVFSEFNNNTAYSAGAAAFGLYASNTSTGSLKVNAHQSTFNSNTVTGIASDAYGLYAYNTASGSIDLGVYDSSFNSNTANVIDGSAYGMNVINVGSGSINVLAVTSFFDENKAYFYDQKQLSSGHAFGLNALNAGAGTLQISTGSSTFNSNDGGTYSYGIALTNTGAGSMLVSAVDSEFNHDSIGLYVDNKSTVPGSIEITNLSGSSFNNNYYYGIYNVAGTVNQEGSPTTVDLNGATFENNGYGDIAF